MFFPQNLRGSTRFVVKRSCPMKASQSRITGAIVPRRGGEQARFLNDAVAGSLNPSTGRTRFACEVDLRSNSYAAVARLDQGFACPRLAGRL